MDFYSKIKYLSLSVAVMFSADSLCLDVSSSAKNDYYTIIDAKRLDRNDIYKCIKGLSEKNKAARVEGVRAYNGNIILKYTSKAYIQYTLLKNYTCPCSY